jgi:hypothetical protein
MKTPVELQLVDKEEDIIMPSEKPLFEARDLGSTAGPSESLFETREPGTAARQGGEAGSKKYLGPERRRDNRRAQADRRGEVRFDAKGSDRRENNGRRETDNSPKFW